MSQDPCSSPPTSLGHSSAKSSPEQANTVKRARSDTGCSSGLVPQPQFSSGSCGEDSSGVSGVDVAFVDSALLKHLITGLFRCEVYEPAILSKDAQGNDEVLDEGPPMRLRPFIDATRRGGQKFAETGELYSFKVTGLGKLNHDDLVTVSQSFCAARFIIHSVQVLGNAGPLGNAVVEGDLVMIWTAPRLFRVWRMPFTD